MEVGNIVKFKDGKVNFINKENIYYRILIINSSVAKCVNKGIALRPISNNSNELFYRTGDLMNQSEDRLEIVNIVMEPKIF